MSKINLVQTINLKLALGDAYLWGIHLVKRGGVCMTWIKRCSLYLEMLFFMKEFPFTCESDLSNTNKEKNEKYYDIINFFEDVVSARGSKEHLCEVPIDEDNIVQLDTSNVGEA